jgi:hypothetical protein
MSNERRYNVKENSMIRVGIRNLSNDQIVFIPVYRPSGSEPEPEPDESLSAGEEALLCSIQVDSNFEWSLENSRGDMPKLIFQMA